MEISHLAANCRTLSFRIKYIKYFCKHFVNWCISWFHKTIFRCGKLFMCNKFPLPFCAIHVIYLLIELKKKREREKYKLSSPWIPLDISLHCHYDGKQGICCLTRPKERIQMYGKDATGQRYGLTHGTLREYHHVPFETLRLSNPIAREDGVVQFLKEQYKVTAIIAGGK